MICGCGHGIESHPLMRCYAGTCGCVRYSPRNTVALVDTCDHEIIRIASGVCVCRKCGMIP